MIASLLLLATIFLIQATGLLDHLGELVAYVQPAVNQQPEVLFHRAAFQPLLPKSVALHVVVVTQCHVKRVKGVW